MREYHDKVEFAAQQADYEMEGLTREHRAALAKMTKDVDVMMAEVQGQTAAMKAGVSAQLKHETQCFHDECSVARALRSDIALLAASQTHPASPASNLFTSPCGTPPKSVVASFGEKAFG